MRESIQLHEMTCEQRVSHLAAALAPVKGLTEARVEMGTGSVIVEYDEGTRSAIDAALKQAGFSVIDRRELPSTAF